MPTELETKLADAEAALHKLMLGEEVSEIAFDDITTKYARRGPDALRLYISELKIQIAKEAGTPRRRAIGVYF